MLDDADIAKLCQGRIIKASFYDSANKNVAGPHYAVILDSDDDVKNRDEYYVAVISSNDQIDSEYIVPVPPKTGLTGFIVCSWTEVAHLRSITDVKAKLDRVEIANVLAVMREMHRKLREQK
jgi:hypothetical protein